MDREHQRDMRREAALSFFDSLDKLQETLNEEDAQPQKSEPAFEAETPAKTNPKQTKKFDLAELEQAAADIEEFFQSKSAKAKDSQG